MTCMTPLESRMSCCRMRAELTKRELEEKVMDRLPPCFVLRLVPFGRFAL